MSKRTFLKIKIMSLAAEASIIRREASKWPRMGMEGTRFELNQHRRYDVRTEARSALLAYGFIRGRAYRRIEAKCWDAPNADRVAQIIVSFSDLGRGEAVAKRKAMALAAVKEWLESVEHLGADLRSVEAKLLSTDAGRVV